MKLFGIWDLTTHFEFWFRASIWSTTAISNYVLEPDFGDNGTP